MTEEEYAKRQPLVAPKTLTNAALYKTKYKNTKIEEAGHKFDSKRELKRWHELLMLELSGEITNLRRQVRYELIPSLVREDGSKERPCSYVADFVFDRAGRECVEDSKGFKTPDYIMKRKLMLLRHGITVKEV